MKAEDRKLFKTAGLSEQNGEEEIIVMQAESKHLVIDSDSLINYERYGTYSRLLRVVCYVFRFIRNLRYKVARKKPSLVGEQCATELHKAELSPPLRRGGSFEDRTHEISGKKDLR